MKCEGTSNSDAQGIGHLIVYGIKGAQNDADLAVYDTVHAVENGDANRVGYEWIQIVEFNSNSIHHIHVILNTNNGKTFLLNGCDKIIIPNYSHMLTIKAMYFNINLSYPVISLKIKHSFLLNRLLTYTSLKSTQLQTITINLNLAFGHMGVELVNDINQRAL